MHFRIRIIIPYFGKFRSSIIPFLNSCAQNPLFDWLIFTDDILDNLPSNVGMVYCTLSDIRARIENCLGFSVALNSPYKLCDFRPAFGLIFKDELVDYDFWGWGDVDLVYGNLSKFITNEILSTYDKIYPCGHLSLLRNCDVINTAFMINTKDSLDYKTVFKDSASYIFDEYKGINEKLCSIGKRVYGKIDFADMDIVYSRFRTADWMTIKLVFPQFMFMKYIPRNYRRQTFWIDSNGRAYRTYINKSGNCCNQELVYIHYRYNIPCTIVLDVKDEYYITNNGFVLKKGELEPCIIDTLNPYKGWFKETKEYQRFFKDRVVMKIGSNKKIRNIVRFIRGKESL